MHNLGQVAHTIEGATDNSHLESFLEAHHQGIAFTFGTSRPQSKWLQPSGAAARESEYDDDINIRK